VAAYEPGKAFKDPRDNADKSYLADYELDRRSVYMGSLPASITADDIKALYQGWTNVQEVRYFPRDMYRGNHKSFAFVVLDRPDMPEVAVKHLVRGFVMSLIILPLMSSLQTEWKTRVRHLPVCSEEDDEGAGSSPG
jgi:hypothetical protein